MLNVELLGDCNSTFIKSQSQALAENNSTFKIPHSTLNIQYSSFCIWRMQNDACSTYGEEGSILDASLFAVTEYNVVYKCAGVAWTVLEDIFQTAVLVAADGYGAMVDVDARVVGLDSAVHSAVLHVASDGVDTHLQGNYLLVVEHVLDDRDIAVFVALGIIFGRVLLLCLAQLGNAYAYAELIAALRTLEHKRLSVGIFLLVECDVVVTFRASYSFHLLFVVLFYFCYPAVGK